MPLTDRDKRTLKIGGITLAGIVGLFLIYTLLSPGGGEVALPSFAPPATSTATGGPSVGPSTGPSASGSGQPTVPPVQNFSGRDPFSVPAILATPASTTTPPTDSGSTSTPPTTTPPSSTPPSTPSGSSTVIGGHTVVLLDVFPRNGKTRAQVEVDGTVYNVAEGGTFAAGQFEFRSASGNCATFLYGDESFTLCATSSK